MSSPYTYSSSSVDYDPDLMDGHREAQPPSGWIDEPQGPTDFPRQRPSGQGRREAAPAPRRTNPSVSPAPSPTPRKQEAQASSAPPRPKIKAKAKRVNRPFREWPLIKFITDKRTWTVCGVILLCLAAYIVVASISYIRSGISDQSAVTSMGIGQMVDDGIKIRNHGGPVGAVVTEYLFAGGLGLGSLALIVYLSLIGLGLMGVRKLNFWSVTFKTLLVAITASVVLGLTSIFFGLEISLGGMHGQYINEYLLARIDWIGALLVSIVLIAAVIGVYFNDLLRLWNRYRTMRRAARERREQEEYEKQLDNERVVEQLAKEDLEANSSSAPQNVENNAATPEETREEEGRPTSTSEYEALEFGESPVPELPAEEDLPEEKAQTEATPVSTPAQTSPATSPAANLSPFLTEEENQEDEEDGPDEDKRKNTQESDEKSLAEPKRTETLSTPGFQVYATEIAKADKPGGASELYDPTAELSHYVPPTLDLLNETPSKGNTVDINEQEENKERITKTLNDYGIPISHIEATVGPTVTLYEIIPAEGVRIAKIKRLEDDIAMSLAALGIRIIAPIPGKGTIGIEVPNKDPQTVSIRSILESKAFQESHMKLPMAMGATISNNVYIADLTKMPHLLVAGATGMGKSVGLNTIIASLLYKKHPAELKFVLVDPKMVEFSLYSVLANHFLAKLPDEEDAVVTDMDKVVRTLNSLCVEMDQRYLLLKDANVRSVTEYNEKFVKKILNPEKGHRYLPYIVMIVDEFADLIMTAGKQVETPIARIAQKARAVGMHMIVATQRPSTNVITGIIKANFPGRIAFRVSQMVDSKTILDRTGANQLIGRGDMLFSHNGSMDRVQCAFIDTPEVQAICDHIKNQIGYEHPYYLPEPLAETDSEGGSLSSINDRDPLFEEAAQFIVTSGEASTSKLQRRYSIGYNRAGKLMDQMEAAGIVGPVMGSKPRQVLVDALQLSRICDTE